MATELHGFSWNVAILAETEIDRFFEDFSTDFYWDFMCIQEFCTSRPDGLQIRNNNLVIIGGNVDRKCPALVIHRRWIPYICNISGNHGISSADLRIPGNRTIRLASVHVDPRVRSANDFEEESF